MRNIKILSNRKILLPVCVFTGLILFWEIAVRALHIPLYVLPAPSGVALALIKNASVIWMHSLVTLEETLIGMAISVVLAVLIALAMDASPSLKSAIYPLLVVTQTVPVIVLAPLFVIYFGFGLAPKVIIVVLVCFFPVTVSFCDGLGRVDAGLLSLLKSFGAKKVQTYLIAKIPAAAPELFSGLKVSATYSIMGAVVGEWLAADKGLGRYMLISKNGYMLDKVFASVVAVVVLSLLMNGLFKLIGHICVPHARKDRRRETGGMRKST
ncbi:MAG: ABC transporter permease [Clostridiales Family XIII bacterium]|jgi:ABC-type nitrate/sulfonate/bicarbonate transport system permease component|nr:ABC transporter permease [Clostridiales Family XIII bacterium]